jgi:hypothetical protein
MISLASVVRRLLAFLPEGDIKKKIYETPRIKPPRRNPSVDNKSNRCDYMKNYMKEYREQGQDYQKMPEKMKQFRLQQRRKLRERLKAQRPAESSLIDKELTAWKNAAKPVKFEEFEQICSSGGFNDDEWKILAEELIDGNLFAG